MAVERAAAGGFPTVAGGLQREGGRLWQASGGGRVTCCGTQYHCNLRLVDSKGIVGIFVFVFMSFVSS